jgi:predicted outer membrane protein
MIRPARLPKPVSSWSARRWKEGAMPTSRRLLLRGAAAFPFILYGAAAQAQDRITPDSSLRLPRQPGAGPSVEDRVFIDQAIGAANAAIKAGAAVERQARSDVVRRVGRDIAADQQATKAELTRLAYGKGIQPSGAAPKELTALSDIGGAADADFDRRYLTAQYRASRWLTALYQNEMAATQDPEIRTFTAGRVLTLRKHLEAIEAAASSVGLRLEAPQNPPQY